MDPDAIENTAAASAPMSSAARGTAPLDGTILRASWVAQSENVVIGDASVYLLTRGEDCTAPILLWLHGGPGAAERPLFRLYDRELENDFIVALGSAWRRQVLESRRRSECAERPPQRSVLKIQPPLQGQNVAGPSAGQDQQPKGSDGMRTVGPLVRNRRPWYVRDVHLSRIRPSGLSCCDVRLGNA
jgi:hypothetical protein